MEKNGCPVVCEVMEAPGVGLDELDLAVHAFGYGIGYAMPTVGQKPREVTLQSSRCLDYRFQARVGGPEKPSVEKLLG